MVDLFLLLLPPANEVWGKVIFSVACVKNSVQGGWWYPSMPCRFPGPHPGGKLRGLAGGVSRPTPKGEVEGSGLGVSRPTPGGWCIPACNEADPPHGYILVSNISVLNKNHKRFTDNLLLQILFFFVIENVKLHL